MPKLKGTIGRCPALASGQESDGSRMNRRHFMTASALLPFGGLLPRNRIIGIGSPTDPSPVIGSPTNGDFAPPREDLQPGWTLEKEKGKYLCFYCHSPCDVINDGPLGGDCRCPKCEVTWAYSKTYDEAESEKRVRYRLDKT